MAEVTDELRILKRLEQMDTRIAQALKHIDVVNNNVVIVANELRALEDRIFPPLESPPE